MILRLAFISYLLGFHGIAWAGDIVFLSHKNQSRFDKPWNLSREIPKYLAAKLPGTDSSYFRNSPAAFYGLLSERKKNLVTLCAQHEAKWVVFGTIRSYQVARSSLGTGAVAGFNTYTGKYAGDLQAYHCPSDSLFTRSLNFKVRDNEMDLRVPTVLISLVKDKYEETYAGLSKAAYGDSLFQITVAGRINDTLVSVLTSLLSDGPEGRLAKADVRPPHSASIPDPKPGIAGSVVFNNGKEAYINLGSAHGIRTGDSISLFKRGAPILDLNEKDTLGYEERFFDKAVVVYIKAEKLSIISTQNSMDQIVKGDRVRLWK